MTFKATATALILAACATLSGADHQTRSFRVPDPEEIYEAYLEGFIEYQEYRELLEISRADFLTPDDSVYLLQFPDLLAGFSSNPLFETEEIVGSDIRGDDDVEFQWQQSTLIRQYQRFSPESQRKRMFRTRGIYHNLSYYGEYESEYSGSQRWCRRYIRYDFASRSGTGYGLAVGNYKKQFGMGLIYGYHGQLLRKSNDRENIERFLYPNYGGGNGIFLTTSHAYGQFKLLYDTDRNADFTKNLLGLSIPFHMTLYNFQLSGVYGHLRNRDSGRSVSVSLASLCGQSKSENILVEGELAGANSGGKLSYAAAARLKWRRQRESLDIDGWMYGRNYPAYFSGGPSSRRSHTKHLEEIDMSYSDRYSGETGVIVKTSYPVWDQIVFRSAAAYARRGFDDDRIEARIGLKNKWGDRYAMKIDCYRRSDRLYSDIRTQRRVQIEIIKYYVHARTRLVLGHRVDKNYDRDDILIIAEGRVSHVWGTMALLCKLDRLRPDDWQYRYLYLTGYYESELGEYLRSYIKYTYRYRKGEPEDSFGTIRLDFGWVIQ